MTQSRRPVALVLALNGLDFDRRAANEALSLTDTGLDVVRVGVRTEYAQLLDERTGFDRIVRIAPVWYPVAQAVDDQETIRAVEEHALLKRQWRWKLALASLVRRYLPRTMLSLDLYRQWLRWNQELTAACEGFEPDLVLATDLDTLLTGHRIKRRTGCVLIYDAHELWIDMPNHTYLTRSFRVLFVGIERYLSRRADMRMTVGDGLASVLARRSGTGRPLVVYNGPELVVETRGQLEAGRLQAYFQGNLQQGRGLEQAVRAMVSLRGKVVLTIQGAGGEEDELRSLAHKLGLDDDGTVRFLPPCPMEEVVICASRYDVGLNSIEANCLNSVMSMPNKLFTYLGGSLAVVTTAEAPETANLLLDRGCGVVVEQWEAPMIANALDSLASDRDALHAMRLRAHEAAMELQWDRQFARVVEWLQGEGIVRGSVESSLSWPP